MKILREIALYCTTTGCNNDYYVYSSMVVGSGEPVYHIRYYSAELTSFENSFYFRKITLPSGRSFEARQGLFDVMVIRKTDNDEDLRCQVWGVLSRIALLRYYCVGAQKVDIEWNWDLIATILGSGFAWLIPFWIKRREASSTLKANVRVTRRKQKDGSVKETISDPKSKISHWNNNDRYDPLSYGFSRVAFNDAISTELNNSNTLIEQATKEMPKALASVLTKVALDFKAHMNEPKEPLHITSI